MMIQTLNDEETMTTHDTTGNPSFGKVLQLRNWSWPKLGSNFGNLQKLQADDADAVN